MSESAQRIETWRRAVQKYEDGGEADSHVEVRRRPDAAIRKILWNGKAKNRRKVVRINLESELQLSIWLACSITEWLDTVSHGLTNTIVLFLSYSSIYGTYLTTPIIIYIQ